MSEVHKFSGETGLFSWDGVNAEPLIEDGLESVTKHILIGEKEGAENYIMRFFYLEPGGHSRLERHPQEHEVIVLTGSGEAQIAEQTYPVKPFDVVFIEGNELHQFRASADESLGFICVIPK